MGERKWLNAHERNMADEEATWRERATVLAREIEADWQMGGLSDGIYFDFAFELWRRMRWWPRTPPVAR